jgi:hypothetical protein
MEHDVDQELIKLLVLDAPARPEGEYRALDRTVRYIDDTSPAVEVKGPDGPRRLTLRPLADLYGTGTGMSTVVPEDERWEPLLLALEEAVVRYYEEIDPGLTDGQVLLSYKQLGMTPEAESADRLSRRLSLAMRLVLSINNYSRQDVRSALRTLAKSVERHTKADGRRGYVDFIRGFFGRRR